MRGPTDYLVDDISRRSEGQTGIPGETLLACKRDRTAMRETWALIGVTV